MSEPDAKGAAEPQRIPPIHPDTITFEALLGDLEPGERISYADLAASVRKSMKTHEGAVKSHIRSAERRLRNGRRMVFGPYHDSSTGERGRIRLDDVEIGKVVSHRVGRLRRAAKSLQAVGSCVNLDALPIEARQALAANMIAASGAETWTAAKSVEKVQRLVADSGERIPALERAWEALTKR